MRATLTLAAAIAAFVAVAAVQEPSGQEPAGQEPSGPEPVAAEPGAQDPDRPPAPPVGTAPLPPVQEPYVAPVFRHDVPGRFTAADPLEGAWQLQSRVIGGRPAAAGRGFMMIGRRHLMVQFMAEGTDPDIPLLRAGTYTWSRVNDSGTVRLTAEFGYYNESDGDVLLEPLGKVEIRRFEQLQASLRLHQADGTWLEFVRLE